MNAIIDAGVTRTPALAVDGRGESAGKVLSVEECEHLVERLTPWARVLLTHQSLRD